MIKHVKQSPISSTSPLTNSPVMVESVPHLPSVPLHDPCSDISLFEDIAPFPSFSQTNLQPESASLQGALWFSNCLSYYSSFDPRQLNLGILLNLESPIYAQGL